MNILFRLQIYAITKNITEDILILFMVQSKNWSVELNSGGQGYGSSGRANVLHDPESNAMPPPQNHHK